MTTCSRTPKPAYASRGGFSLLELTLVLLIFSMLAALALSSVVARKMSQDRDLTIARIDEIQKKMLAFRIANHRLPCPADPTLTLSSASNGREARTGDCTASLGGYPGTLRVAAGAVPTKSIGLDDEYMYDGWGRRFRYIVMQEFTRNCAFADHPVQVSGYEGLYIEDTAGNTLTESPLYAVISHGQNGHGAYLPSGEQLNADSTNASEHENCDCAADLAATGLDRDLVDGLYSESSLTTLNRFDDYMRYKAREELASQSDVRGTTEVCP